MKKQVIKILIFSILCSIFILPLEVNAKTIKEFEREVNKYTSELENKRKNLATNDREIAEIKRKVANTQKQIQKAENEIVELQKEIDESNKEIKRKSEESKSIIEYYQISNGTNAYLEYAFGAKTITDMIYRISVVEQLIEYNDNIMKELERLIAENENKQKQLRNKEAELKKLEKKLRAEGDRIYADSVKIKGNIPTIEKQISEAKANLKYYKGLGCGENEDIQACQYRIQEQSGSSVPSVNGFYRPMHNGYITQGYHGFGGHLGIDLSSNNKTIPIYPIAQGVVFKIYYDNCNWNNCMYGCNGKARVVKIRHNVGNKYIYSTYAHLSSFGNIREGMFVTPFTKIGEMGNTGCSTGPHLHLEISTCDWNRGGGCTWYQYQRRTVNPTRYVQIPSRWNNR